MSFALLYNLFPLNCVYHFIERSVEVMGMSKAIKEAMRYKGIKSNQLADTLGRDRQVFYNWLYKDTMGDKVIEVADALGCDVVLIDRKTRKQFRP